MTRLSGTTCPRCGQSCYELSTGKLSEHKTEFYVTGQRAGGRVRERCVYSGGTWRDAKDKISPLRRSLLDRSEES